MSKHKYNYDFRLSVKDHFSTAAREVFPLTIRRHQVGEFVYYEALFMGGNLYAFHLVDLLLGLMRIHGFKPKTLFYPELKYENQ